MRSLLIVAAAGAAAWGCYSLSKVLEGLPGAVSYMVSLLLVPVGLGLAIGSLRMNTLRRPRASDVHDPRRCGHCYGDRQLSGQYWVCHRCDLIAAHV